MGLIPDLAAQRAALSPEAPAFIDHQTAEVWGFARVDAAAARLAAALAALVPKGGRVAILCLNRPEFFVALFACQKAGLILAPLNWRMPLAELVPIVAQVRAALVLHDEAFRDIAAGLGLPAMALDIPDGPPLPAARIDEDAPWYVLFTSGTTGRPKAVIQTARMALACGVNVAMAMGLTADDRSANYLPLFHTAGINLFTLPLFLWGGCSLILRRFDAETLADLLDKGALTQFFGVPTIYQTLAERDLGALPLSRVRGWACGGAALPESLMRRFAEAGAVIRAGFGMTETGPTGMLMDADAALSRIGWVGKPQLMTEARLDGIPDGAPGIGELLLRGPSVTPGYLDNAQATAQAFTAEGWLRSGDIAQRDAEGYYRIIDRLKDMYISGGENVFPAEVEAAILAHPLVIEAAVIGAPDPRWGESGVAFLVAREGLDPTTLRPWLRERLASFKVPRAFHLVSDLPRTATGKVRKSDLRTPL